MGNEQQLELAEPPVSADLLGQRHAEKRAEPATAELEAAGFTVVDLGPPAEPVEVEPFENGDRFRFIQQVELPPREEAALYRPSAFIGHSPGPRRTHLARPRVGRAPRRACNTRTRGSSRTSSDSSSSRGDPDDGDPEPPGLRLWRRSRWGSCSPNLPGVYEPVLIRENGVELREAS